MPGESLQPSLHPSATIIVVVVKKFNHAIPTCILKWYSPFLNGTVLLALWHRSAPCQQKWRGGGRAHWITNQFLPNFISLSGRWELSVLLCLSKVVQAFAFGLRPASIKVFLFLPSNLNRAQRLRRRSGVEGLRQRLAVKVVRVRSGSLRARWRSSRRWWQRMGPS